MDTSVKTAALQMHLPVAMLVLVLTVTRLIWLWQLDTKPGPVVGVPPWQDSIARWTHRGLCAVVILLLASGIKYLNTIIEQDHHFIKKITRPMQTFKSFNSAASTLAGIEVAHMIRKGQFDWLELSGFKQFAELAG